MSKITSIVQGARANALASVTVGESTYSLVEGDAGIPFTDENGDRFTPRQCGDSRAAAIMSAMDRHLANIGAIEEVADSDMNLRGSTEITRKRGDKGSAKRKSKRERFHRVGSVDALRELRAKAIGGAAAPAAEIEPEPDTKPRGKRK